MSKLLFSFMGGHGHFVPLKPLAQAARSAGHDVAFACGGSMRGAVEAAGFEVFPLGPGSTEPPQRAPLRQLDAAREADEFRDRFADSATRRKLPLIEAVCREWGPDVVVCDEADFGSMLAAERLGLPYASVLVMAAGAFVRPALITDVLNAIRSEHGLAPDPALAMLHRYLALSPFPPGFRDPAVSTPPTVHAFRPDSTDRAAATQLAWPGMRISAPLIYFSLGTVFNIESGNLFNRVLDGLRELPANLIVTVGHEIDPAEFGDQPSHVRIERYRPQDEILPGCDLIVSHGGSGSVAGALAHGVPLLITPMGADQLDNAARCQALGIGRWLDPLAATPADVREAAAEILSQPRYRLASAPLRDEFVALLGPEQALGLLERLIETRAPVITSSR